jgi:hypothetical protein
MDVSTEFDQRACFLVACDPSSMRPRNKTLTKVVHVLPDDFFGILSLVRLLPPFFCDQLVIYCLSYAGSIKKIDPNFPLLVTKTPGDAFF